MKYLNSIIFLSSLAISAIRGEVKYFSKCVKNGDFAITFDDGPSLDYSNAILDILDEYKVKATFFVNGKNCVDITTNDLAKAILKREYESGHVIGSHTFTHPFGITTLSKDELTYELNALNDALYDIIGVKPAFFRPPLGEYSEENLKVIEQCGIKANILWNLDSEDWDHNYNATQQYIDNLEGKDPYAHSFIALNHDIQKVTAETNLKIVIPYLKKLGYNLVPMDVCIGLPAYQSDYDENSNPKKIPSSNNNNNNNNNNSNGGNNGISKDGSGETVSGDPQNLNNNDNNNSNNNGTNNSNTNNNNNGNGNALPETSDANIVRNSVVLSVTIMLLMSILLL
ncbi:glycoside hydrolase/deacetylase [Anaeromyces robustus]|uniref:Glycoside hydrolase/deacetylase n=1 Tax=Anaeromyces robustus TaxID=1754192 RepID=A0A1Y1XM85_9FUNG|nr:glycoside hydrolase/deacetylase [Anaeromyces robustus]|eukprot:ORX86857.1 glycoside hydrolase/deacetylase [Anaeromyces robustus]